MLLLVRVLLLVVVLVRRRTSIACFACLGGRGEEDAGWCVGGAILLSNQKLLPVALRCSCLSVVWLCSGVCEDRQDGNAETL